MTLSIPPLPPFQPEWPDFQVWWQLAKTNIETAQNDLADQVAAIAAAQAAADAAQADADAAQADATAALATLSDISNDNILDIGEKQLLIPIVQRIINEKAGIDAQATALSITTEKTTYDTKYTALVTTYLGGLSPAYTDTSAPTTIVRATFNTKFQDYYDARQALLNKIDSVASTFGVVINPVADVIIYADVSGVVTTTLPKLVNLSASSGNATVTTSGTWSRTVTSGITCTIGAATGILSISGMTGSDVYIPVSFVYGSGATAVTRTASVHVKRQDDPPSNTGGAGATGGTTASTTTLGNTTGTVYDTTNAVSATLSVLAGTGGQIDTVAPLGYIRTSASDGETKGWGKWQWRVPAGVWADMPTGEQGASVNAITDTSSGDTVGVLSVSDTKTGLVSGSTYELRFLWRRTAVAPVASDITRTSGTLTATGS